MTSRLSDLRPVPADLAALIEAAKSRPAENRRVQALSWARAEAGFGSDADEAEYAAAIKSGDPERIAKCKAAEEARMAAFDRIMKGDTHDPTPQQDTPNG